jgi:hypothetical protein
MDKKQDGVQEAASQLVKLLRDAELKQNDALWLEAATAIVAHARAQAGGCMSRKWQLAAEAARTIPALIGIMSHAAAPPALKVDAVDALRLTVCTNDINQSAAAASSAAQVLLHLITVLPPPPPASEGPKAAVLARNVGEQLRDAALEALADLVHLHKPSQDAAVAASAIPPLISFIYCTGPPNLNPVATQRAALRALANLTRSNVGGVTCAGFMVTCWPRCSSDARKVNATAAAADAGALAALVAAGRSRLVAADTQELVAAALVSLVQHPGVADAACAQGVLSLMMDILRAQPPGSLALEALTCSCMMLYGRGDACALAAKDGLLPLLQQLRAQGFGEEFDARCDNCEAALQHYT